MRRLKREGFWVRGTDLKFPRFSETEADDFVIGDLRDHNFVKHVIDRRFDEIYQLAADMGGAGYIFTGEHDADVMHNSAIINLNMLNAAHMRNNKRIFYSSSACIYPDTTSSIRIIRIARKRRLILRSRQRIWLGEAFQRAALSWLMRGNYGMEVRIARYHNIFGPEGSWNDGKEKAPAAICRKVALAADGERSRSGVTESRHAPSCTSMNVWKVPYA